ncbi:MAG: putative serine protease PepD [Micromonosporaceae bacterium]|nr:putative serine protease PepD [Micromonosporaceae bacterium]
MSEQDSGWAARTPDDGGIGQPPRHQHGPRDESTGSAATEPTSGASGSASSGAAAGSSASSPGAAYQGGSYSGGGYQPQAPTSPPTPAYQSSSGYRAPTQETSAYPTQGYQARGYETGHAAPGYGTGGYPTVGTPYAGYPGPGNPAGTPGWRPGTGNPSAGHAQSSSGGRIARGGVIVVGAVAIALMSGVAGGAAAHYYDKGQPATTVTRRAAPVEIRGSVASVAAAVQPAVVDISTSTGEGSGVVISADGNILTNNHVLQGAQGNTLNVTFNDGKKVQATIVGTDPAGDLGVIKAQGVSGLTAAKFANSDDVQVGDTVLALGSPLGLQGSVTAGIVSALHRTIDEGADETTGAQHSIGDALQTDAAINPGNSGGALVNLAGEVVGINTAIATSGQGASGNIGVGFAISSNVAKSTADQLLKGGKVTHPYLGVQLTDGEGGGALVADVVAGGPAAKAGIQKGDVITKLGSHDIPDSKALVSAVKAAKAGDQIQLTVRRNGSEQQITATLGDSS